MSLFYLLAVVVLALWVSVLYRRLKALGGKLERASLSSEVRYHKLFESNMVGLVEIDAEDRICEANGYFLNLIGYKREELKKMNIRWSDITSPETLAASQWASEEIGAGLMTEPFEKEYVRKDGQRVPALVASTPLSDSNGRRITVVLDLTKQKSAEKILARSKADLEQMVEVRTQQLSRSQKFMDSILENIPNMIFVKDAKDLRFVRFNRAGEELLGYSNAQLIGKNDYDFFPKEQADFFTAEDHTVLKEKVAKDIPEEPVLTQKGLRVLHTIKIPILDDQNRPQYLLGISEDITEKKKSEEQRLRLAEERAARKVAEENADHLAFLSQTINILATSSNYQEALNSFAKALTKRMADWCVIDMLDVSEEPKTIAMYHKDPEKLKFARELRARFPEEWKSSSVVLKVIKSGQPMLFTDVTDKDIAAAIPQTAYRSAIRKFGVRSLMVVPLKIHDRILGAITFIYAESDCHYKQLDLAIAHDLARRASFAIENARLFERAQEANRAKTDFLKNMSHEVRTPLGAIIGFAELVRDSPNLGEEEKNFISTIIRNGQQLLRIVNEILDISKVESETVTIERVAFALPTVIHDVMDLLRPQAEEKGLKLEATAETPLPQVIVSDPTRLRQLLTNTIGNSIKFTQEGRVDVKVRARPLDSTPKKVKLCFSIQDTGIGIGPDEARQLFQPFVQADSSTRRRYGGTGLGLYLSKKLAQKLGGDLILEKSEVGKGSTFVFSIEAEIAESQAAPALSHKKDARDLEIPMGKPMKVLIVDDAADNRLLVSRFLQQMGVEADQAQNGKEGIEKALRHNYDLILMDIQMPELDGFEALAKLRKANYAKPVVALTAHAMKGDRDLCLAQGFDDYLVKPVNRDSLRRTLVKYQVPFAEAAHKKAEAAP